MWVGDDVEEWIEKLRKGKGKESGDLVGWTHRGDSGSFCDRCKKLGFVPGSKIYLDLLSLPNSISCASHPPQASRCYSFHQLHFSPRLKSREADLCVR